MSPAPPPIHVSHSPPFGPLSFHALSASKRESLVFFSSSTTSPAPFHRLRRSKDGEVHDRPAACPDGLEAQHQEYERDCACGPRYVGKGEGVRGDEERTLGLEKGSRGGGWLGWCGGGVA